MRKYGRSVYTVGKMITFPKFCVHLLPTCRTPLSQGIFLRRLQELSEPELCDWLSLRLTLENAEQVAGCLHRRLLPLGITLIDWSGVLRLRDRNCTSGFLFWQIFSRLMLEMTSNSDDSYFWFFLLYKTVSCFKLF